MPRVSGASRARSARILAAADLVAFDRLGGAVEGRVGDALQLAFDVGGAQGIPGERPQPGLHARHKGEDGSDGAH